MTWLWILLSIIAFFVILLACKVRIFYIGGNSEGSQEDTLKIKYLFFTYTVMPKKEKKLTKRRRKKQAKKEKKKLLKEKDKKPKPKQSFSDKIELVKTIVKAIDGTLKKFVGRIKVSLALSMRVGRDDAAETAMDYGKINSYVYSAYAIISNAVNFKKIAITIDPDFENEVFEYKISCKLTASLFIIVSSALAIMMRFAKITAEKKGQKPSDDKEKSKLSKTQVS